MVCDAISNSVLRALADLDRQKKSFWSEFLPSRPFLEISSESQWQQVCDLDLFELVGTSIDHLLVQDRLWRFCRYSSWPALSCSCSSSSWPARVIVIHWIRSISFVPILPISQVLPDCHDGPCGMFATPVPRDEISAPVVVCIRLIRLIPQGILAPPTTCHNNSSGKKILLDYDLGA